MLLGSGYRKARRLGRAGWSVVVGSGGQHHGKNVVAEVADVLALEVHALSLEPSNESGNAFVDAAVAANFDAGGHGAGEGVDAAAANEVSAEGADGEERRGSGHGWLASSGSSLPPMNIL